MLEFTQYQEVGQIKLSREFEGKPIYWVAAYLVDGLLIDTGCDHTALELRDFLRDKNVTQAVNTHYHEDHIGGNWVISELFNLDIMAHPDTIPLMQLAPQLFPYQEVAWGYPQPSLAVPAGDIITTPSCRFEVLLTPGHCPGHIVLLEKSKGWCFSGDIFVSKKLKVIRPEENIAQIITSLHQLSRQLETEFTLFTSIGNIFNDGAATLAQGIDYFETTVQQIQRLHQGGSSAEEICQKLFGGDSNLAAMTSGQFSAFHLIRSALAG